MTTRPILMSAPMVKAILDGRKIQTRRKVKLNDAGRVAKGGRQWHVDDPAVICACPYGTAGNSLWVRETWAQNANQLSDTMIDTSIVYRADGERRAQDNGVDLPWRPSIFMPRRASRITLEVTGVRVEKLNAISKADCIAEGIEGLEDVYAGWHQSYADLWESINGKDSWAANPLVWVVAFKRIGN